MKCVIATGYTFLNETQQIVLLRITFFLLNFIELFW